jgi:hypothetical protein
VARLAGLGPGGHAAGFRRCSPSRLPRNRLTAGLGLDPLSARRTCRHSTCFHRATPTNGRVPLHPGWGHAPRPFGMKIFYFRTSRPPAPAEDRRAIADARPRVAHRARWFEPGRALAALQSGQRESSPGGRHSGPWELTVIPGRRRPGPGKEPGRVVHQAGLSRKSVSALTGSADPAVTSSLSPAAGPASPPDRPSGPAPAVPDLAAARTGPNSAAIPANPQAPLWRPSGQDSPPPHRNSARRAAAFSYTAQQRPGPLKGSRPTAVVIPGDDCE